MKAYVVQLVVIAFVYSFSSYGQHANAGPILEAKNKVSLQVDNQSKDGLVITGYIVEEMVHMAFGKRVVRYQVPRLDMLNAYDLGPNNTRTVTPIYGKVKVKTVGMNMSSKVMVEPVVVTTLKPVNIEATAPDSYSTKTVYVNVLNTYEKVLKKGYKSIDMLKKVADRSYFEGNLDAAVKFYSELIDMDKNVEAVYYFRYSQSLKGLGQSEKANEMMEIFERKNKK